MGATHIAVPRTQQWLNSFCLSWMHSRASLISFCTTHFQAAAKLDWCGRRISLHPTVVVNDILCNKVPTRDAAGCSSTWLGDKMRIISTAGIFGWHSWPLKPMGRGGGGLVMVVASRRKSCFSCDARWDQSKFSCGGRCKHGS